MGIQLYLPLYLEFETFNLLVYRYRSKKIEKKEIEDFDRNIFETFWLESLLSFREFRVFRWLDRVWKARFGVSHPKIDKYMKVYKP